MTAPRAALALAVTAAVALGAAPASAVAAPECYQETDYPECLVDYALARVPDGPPSVPSAPKGVTATATYQGTLHPKGGLTVAYECVGAATGAAASVNVSRCGIQRNAALALPGPASVIAGTETIALAPFRVCWTVSATFVDGAVKTTSGCTPVLTGSAVDSFSGAGASTA
jgi:hypothetical protein